MKFRENCTRREGLWLVVLIDVVIIIYISYWNIDSGAPLNKTYDGVDLWKISMLDLSQNYGAFSSGLFLLFLIPCDCSIRVTALLKYISR